jgi:hypothetical protein
VQIALGGTIQKLVAVFVAGIPLVLVGAVVYKFVSGETFMSGVTHLYGGLYHIPGERSCVCVSGNTP